MLKLTSYFDTTRFNDREEISHSLKTHPKKRNKLVNPCLGFNYGKNSELLELYNKCKKKDGLNESIYSLQKWSSALNDGVDFQKADSIHLLSTPQSVSEFKVDGS